LIFSKPSEVKCSFLFIKLTTNKKSSKSNLLELCKGYLSKKGIIISTISENLATTKFTLEFVGIFIRLPQPKHFCIFSNNSTSRISKIGLTLQPDDRSLLLVIDIIKEDSASANPVTQKGFRRQTGFLNDIASKTSGLYIGILSGKAAFIFNGRPRFIDALMATNFCNPSIVRCSLLLIKLTAILNRR
ncbi:hypothetical protein HOY82DRAFT_495566, partial [Tuber indicum]